MTFPRTRSTPRSAGSCAGKIELRPSRRLAAAWSLWLAACISLLLLAVALPLLARGLMSAALMAANVAALRGYALLRGARAIRAITWDDAGGFRLTTGCGDVPATLSPAAFRLGRAWLVLWFDTPCGRRAALIDGARQDRAAFCRLSRRLARGMLIPSGPKV